MHLLLGGLCKQLNRNKKKKESNNFFHNVKLRCLDNGIIKKQPFLPLFFKWFNNSNLFRNCLTANKQLSLILIFLRLHTIDRFPYF
jgi:hypothetical protein